jgi:hypothetical protein
MANANRLVAIGGSNGELRILKIGEEKESFELVKSIPIRGRNAKRYVANIRGTTNGVSMQRLHFGYLQEQEREGRLF